jgi:hypothetical protein
VVGLIRVGGRWVWKGWECGGWMGHFCCGVAGDRVFRWDILTKERTVDASGLNFIAFFPELLKILLFFCYGYDL